MSTISYQRNILLLKCLNFSQSELCDLKKKKKIFLDNCSGILRQLYVDFKVLILAFELRFQILGNKGDPS